MATAKFSVLEHQMDPSSNFSSYRSTLKAAMWRSAGAVDDRQKIVIPFFSLLVKDLYFLNEGCANKWVLLICLELDLCSNNFHFVLCFTVYIPN